MSLVVRSDVTIAPTWSPGVAVSGTVTVNGTSADWPAGTTTAPAVGAAHAPMPWAVSSVVRTFSVPSSLV